jgi:hypothetical protein
MEARATIGEAKVAFNGKYARPVNGPQQGFVNEMLTSVTLATCQRTYKPSRVFYLGYETLCKTFLAAVDSDFEREKLYDALAEGVGFDGPELKKEAEKLASSAGGLTEEQLFAAEDLALIPSAGLKYNYPLGAGLIALMPLVSVEPSDESIARWCGKLGLPASRLQSDYAFFKDAQQKMAQAQQMLMEMAAASKRKEAKKLLEDAEKAAKEAAEAEAAASAA